MTDKFAVTEPQWRNTLQRWQSRVKGYYGEMPCGFCEALIEQEKTCEECPASPTICGTSDTPYLFGNSLFDQWVLAAAHGRKEKRLATQIVNWLIEYGAKRGWKP